MNDTQIESEEVTSRGEWASERPTYSIARQLSERREVEQGVRLLLEKQRKGILRAVGPVLLFAALPIVLFVAAREFTLDRASWILGLEVIGLALATFGANVRRFSTSLRGQLVTMGLTATAAMSLLHFGPLMGTGFFFVGSVLFAALHVPAWQAYLCGAFLCSTVVVCTVLSGMGVALPGELELNFQQWLRTSLAAIVSITTILFVFLKVQGSLWDSLANQIGLRIRERRFLEEKERMVRTAGSVQRLESLGRLAGGIAHDFNNSLVVIQCGLGVLEDEVDEAERREVLAEVRDGVTRAASTARQLLSFAKRNVEELGTCKALEVAERLREDGPRLLPAHIKLQVETPEPESLPRVGLSESAATQLILTLVQNAREALGERAGNVKIRFEAHPQTGGLFLKVLDDGPGMSPDVEERVWEPFFTTKGDNHTGLGLSTVWAMMRRHGGEVNLESDEGVGTTVTMLFPPVASEEIEYERVPQQEGLKGEGGRTVLILEDEAPIRIALRRVLKHTGLTVVEAETVAEARAAIQGRRFALLVSDGVLPDGGAGEFIVDFLAEQRAPVILCSGYLEEDLALEGVTRGECTFLPKPFNPEKLVELVHSLLPPDSAE